MYPRERINTVNYLYIDNDYAFEGVSVPLSFEVKKILEVQEIHEVKEIHESEGDT